MPTIDGGHIFLTLLAPVKTGEREWNGQTMPHVHVLREELSNLPTAAQSPVSIETRIDSPFACCTRTHFVRLFVIDQPMFNGRDPMNPLKAAATGINPLAGKAAKQGADPLIHQPFDVLSRSWLVLSADIDRRPDQPDDGIASWAEHLWTKREDAMRAIFSHCCGFDSVNSPAAFADYLKRCQIDTTMSFNDYWPGRPPLKGESFGKLGLLAGGAALLVTALLWFLFNPGSMWWLLPMLLVGLAAGVGLAIWRLWSVGGKAFPPAPDSDLPSVLKALHCQQRFASFVERAQALDETSLHASFGQLLAELRPDDVTSPTQSPGVIRSDNVNLVEHQAVQPKRVVR